MASSRKTEFFSCIVNINLVLPYLGGNISVYIEQVQATALIHMFLTLYKVPLNTVNILIFVFFHVPTTCNL
jgi:hypothetical protein